ncbi:MAG: adenine deaminase [Bacteroidales bacterium]
MILKGKIVDIHNRRIFNGEVKVTRGIIEGIRPSEEVPDLYILPGFIDSHVHVESSMVTPGHFAEAAVKHGTVGVVADPHEIANVLGVKGVDFMIENGRSVPFRFYFGAPSCVPATDLESSGARIGVEEISELLGRDEIGLLSEMMNFPGVINGDREVLEKLRIAIEKGKRIDGHAPGVTGEALKKYVEAGITTDHEATSLEEGREKILLGMKVIIREGSAARNLNALHPLLAEFPGDVMFCSDDIHPEMLVKRHINGLVRRLVTLGYDLFDIIRSVTLNPVVHYGLDAGLLRAGDKADFIIVKDLIDFDLLETWIGGNCVYSNGTVHFKAPQAGEINNFNSASVLAGQLEVITMGDKVRVIDVTDGELVTGQQIVDAWDPGILKSRAEMDLLKIVVKERYRDLPPVVGFIKGIGLKKGAFAGSVAHDSHNIIAVGVDDESIAAVINRVIELKGGLAVSDGEKITSLRLEIAGIMSDVPCGTIAPEYERLSSIVKHLGSRLEAPFMTLSFMSLLVIPRLKIGDRGLFLLDQFKFVDLFC